MSPLALDSNVFIYWFERNPEFLDAAKRVISALVQGEATGYCSTLAYTEVFRGDTRVFDAMAAIQSLSFVPVTEQVAQLAGQYRHMYGIKGPDSIHLATAVTAGAERFITNDKALAKLTIPDLRIEPL